MSESTEVGITELLQEAHGVMASSGWCGLADWTVSADEVDDVIHRVQASVRILGFDAQAIEAYRMNCYESMQEHTANSVENQANVIWPLKKIFQVVSDSLVDTMLSKVVNDSQAIAEAFGAKSNIKHTRNASSNGVPSGVHIH